MAGRFHVKNLTEILKGVLPKTVKSKFLDGKSDRTRTNIEIERAMGRYYNPRRD